MKRRTPLLASLLLALGILAAPTTPAHADPVYGCDGALCFYSGVFNPPPDETYSGSLPRNTCYHLLDYNDNSWVNKTSFRWYGFHTANCTGAHIEFAPNGAGVLPTGWSAGTNDPVHGVYRTSSTS